jgi:hypothetical protein
MHTDGIPLHIGINYVVSPPPEINKEKHLAFLKTLTDAGIDFGNANITDQEIFIGKKTPPLQIRVITTDRPVGQLLVVAPHPNRPFALFCKEVESVVRAFGETWKSRRQILTCDSTIRYLYESSSEHGFKELWETRLRQPENALSTFGRPVLGGGLRFVMPPTQSEDDPAQIEVKIESYLQDSKKIFVEVEFKWLQPKPPGASFEPIRRLKTINEYITNQVVAFVNEGV